MKKAIEYARSRQSSLTTMIHLSHVSPHSWETIPIFENLCFVIALFRSHVMANTLEGRELLDKILAFQISAGEHTGLFPRYVHEYPGVQRKGYLISIALALYRLKRHHAQVLHVELQQALSRAIGRLIEALQEQTWMDSISVLLRVMQGELPDRESLLALRPRSIRECIYLLHITQILFMQEHPNATEMFQHLTSHWSSQMNAYIGPLEKEWYLCGEEPISLFHYFMHTITGTKRQIAPGLVHLHASLLYSSEKYLRENLPTCAQKLPNLHANWKIQQTGKFLWQMCTQLPEQVCRGFHLFRILWVDGVVYSMVCQQLVSMTYQRIDEIESTITFEEIPEYGLEIHFRKTKNAKIYSNGKRATCFSTGEWITIDTGNSKLALQFTSPENIPAVATLSMHHRPAELQPSHSNVDWRLSIRVLSTDSKHRSIQLRVREGTDCPLQVPLCADHCLHTKSHQ